MTALLQHNANVLMVAIELLLGGVRIQPSYAPFTLLFGCFYVVGWHQTIRFAYTRTLMYHFLTWRKGRAYTTKVSAALISVLIVFGFAASGCAAMRSHRWGPPLIVALTLAIMRVRRPNSAQLKAE